MLSHSSPAVSVIIPVYNAEKYLNQCLDSALAQTLQNIEIICVNDGSTDRSEAILTEYAARDSRIRVISQSNSGAGAARNRGIDTASGEYIAFLDADDFWAPDLLKSIYTLSADNSTDIGLFPFAVYDEKTGASSPTSYKHWLPSHPVFQTSDVFDRLFQMTTASPGFRLYRRDLLRKNKLYFLEQHIAEDMYFVYLALAFSHNICYISETFAWLRRGMSTNLSSSLEKYPEETHHSLLKIKERLEEAGLYESCRETFRIAAIASSEYIFWHVPEDILPMERRRQMLTELNIDDKPAILPYRGNTPENTGLTGKLKTVTRLLTVYGLRYTLRMLRN